MNFGNLYANPNRNLNISQLNVNTAHVRHVTMKDLMRETGIVTGVVFVTYFVLSRITAIINCDSIIVTEVFVPYCVLIYVIINCDFMSTIKSFVNLPVVRSNRSRTR